MIADSADLIELCAGAAGYGSQHIFRDVSLTIRRGEILGLIGRSGSGKTTLLRCLARLEPLKEGNIVIDPGTRVGLLFQRPVLQPWLTAGGHLQVAAQLAGVPVNIPELLSAVGLAGYANERVHTLSGGMQSRLALARALAQAPDVLLLDEPYGSLDVVACSEMYTLISRLVTDHNLGVVLVTHNLFEAAQITHRSLVLTGRPATVAAMVRFPGPVPRSAAELSTEPVADAIRELEQQLRTDG